MNDDAEPVVAVAAGVALWLADMTPDRVRTLIDARDQGEPSTASHTLDGRWRPVE